MKEKKPKIIFHKNLNPTRDKSDPEPEKLKKIIEADRKRLERANEILDKYPVPQWIMDL